ncbi:hypothetical protein [Lacticaseibacillus camelliae]|uniref:Lipoprotein n=1 Tax=Lacticaseibacillus camelliae DSM 22697 = JCM 13995 TaxID=1423730 RepID=A0A0R2FC82_9LACO|nr:hypothetical protein [Lacticaseibacillus camelliae]KRN25062.1 hypothetical protein FC75_GL000973 [Lacticaseibacillus camelliae DSM 22697 = JCM 13995]
MNANFSKAILLALIPLTLLTACGIGQPSSQSPAQSECTYRSGVSHLRDVENRGLPVANKQEISGSAMTDLKRQYGADIVSAVSFTNDHGTKMYIIVTKSTAGANAVRERFAKANWSVKADPSRRLVFAAERSLASGWFEKYQKAIFRG